VESPANVKNIRLNPWRQISNKFVTKILRNPQGCKERSTRPAEAAL
jgi:hypothetical protein